MRGLTQLFVLLAGFASNLVHAASIEALAAAEALLLHDAASGNTYLHANGAHFRYFVSVAGGDPPAEALERWRVTGLTFLPGSDWKLEPGKRVGRDMHVSIGEPEPLPDGTFRINYSFHCGTLCHSTNVAILKHDASGWHVVSTQLETIS